jgi:hypothetical protein
MELHLSAIAWDGVLERMELKAGIHVAVYTEVHLSRRNLLTLLAKLDGKPPSSAATIFRQTHEGHRLVVIAEEDDAHYRGRTPGPVHRETEAAIVGCPVCHGVGGHLWNHMGNQSPVTDRFSPRPWRP